MLLAIHLNLIVSLSRGQFPTHGWNKNLFYTNLIETCFFPTKIQKSYQPLQISVCIFIYFIFFILEVYCIPTGCYLFFSVNQLLYCYAGSNPNLIYVYLNFLSTKIQKDIAIWISGNLNFTYFIFRSIVITTCDVLELY